MNIDVLKDLSPAEPASAGDLPPFGLFAAGVYPFLEFRWFHEAYYRVLEAFAAGRVRRLIVTMPPQHGKSVGASTLLPAYLLGRNPDLRIAIASYSASLASKFNRRVQRIIDSPEYAAFFPETTIKRGARPPEYLRTADEVEIIGHRGGLLSVGREGGAHGQPCGLLHSRRPLQKIIKIVANQLMNEKICLVFNLKFMYKGKRRIFRPFSLTFIDTMQFNSTEF